MRVSNYKILLLIIFTPYTCLQADSLTTTNNHIAQAITYLNEITSGNIQSMLQTAINNLVLRLDFFLNNAQKSTLYSDSMLAPTISMVGSTNNQINLTITDINQLITAANSAIQQLNDLAPRTSDTKPLSTQTIASALLVLCTTLSKVASESMLPAVGNNYGTALCNTYNLLTKLATRYNINNTTPALTALNTNLSGKATIGDDGIATYIPGSGTTADWRVSITTNLLSLCAVIMQNFITEYAFGQSGPYSIIKASNDILWAGEFNSNHIASIDDNGTLIRRLSIDGYADHLAADTNGNVWSILENSNKLIKVSPIGIVTTYTLPTSVSESSYALTFGPDNTIWYTNKFNNKIGKFNIATSTATEYTAPAPSGIVAGIDAALYFTSCTVNDNKIGRITSDGTITYYSSGLTANSLNNPDAAIICDPQGTLWFLETSANKIGKLAIGSGYTTIAEYTIPTANANCRNGITYGPDGCIWFVESNANKIGRLNPTNGVFTEFTIPTDNARPWGCCIAEDGSLWFTEQGGNKTSRIELIQ